MNETLARALGVNSSRVRLSAFALGAGLACAAGALITPLSSVDPNMGVPWLTNAFMLAMVSGSSLVSLAVGLPAARRRAGAGQRDDQPDPRRADHRRARRGGAAHPARGLLPWLTWVHPRRRRQPRLPRTGRRVAACRCWRRSAWPSLRWSSRPGCCRSSRRTRWCGRACMRWSRSPSTCCGAMPASSPSDRPPSSASAPMRPGWSSRTPASRPAWRCWR